MQYEKLSYLVVSDQGESEMFLRSLLRQVHPPLPSLARVLWSCDTPPRGTSWHVQIFEHMVMVFGRQAIEEGKYRCVATRFSLFLSCSLARALRFG